MTVFGLVRHGVTDWNLAMRAQGHTDIPLNAEGRKQAEKLARRLIQEDWDCVYASDLSRARETAEAIAVLKNIPLSIDPGLREIFLGQIEGLTKQDAIDKWGENYRELDLGIEPPDVLGKRGLDAIARIDAEHPGRKVLLVSHGGFLSAVLKQLVPDSHTAHALSNTSLTILRKQPASWHCELYNCTQHLAEE